MSPSIDRSGVVPCLAGRLSGHAVKALGQLAVDDKVVREALFAAAGAHDDRVAYNALWALTHAARACREWLSERRDTMIDILLRETHIGRRRLLLSLLECTENAAASFRGDYFDFCIERINSAEPYGVRALCLKQAYALCLRYPALMPELRARLSLMDSAGLSPGLKSVLRKIEIKG